MGGGGRRRTLRAFVHSKRPKHFAKSSSTSKRCAYLYSASLLAPSLALHQSHLIKTNFESNCACGCEYVCVGLHTLAYSNNANGEGQPTGSRNHTWLYYRLYRAPVCVPEPLSSRAACLSQLSTTHAHTHTAIQVGKSLHAHTCTAPLAHIIWRRIVIPGSVPCVRSYIVRKHTCITKQ